MSYYVYGIVGTVLLLLLSEVTPYLPRSKIDLPYALAKRVFN